MRRSDILRTSSFRIGLLFLALFGLSSLVLFSFVYARSVYYERAQRDGWLKAELAGSLAESESQRLARLDQRLLSDPMQQRPFGLYDARGIRLAGNGFLMPPPSSTLDAPFDVEVKGSPSIRHYRAIAHALAGGRRLVFATQTDEADGFLAQLGHTLAVGAMIMLAIGVAGASLLGVGTARRIRAARTAIQRIMAGHLSDRLPVGRRHGDVEELSIAVNQMLDELERLVDEVKGVCDGIAHDMRTPLGRLLARLERARRREEAGEALDRTIDSAIDETKAILRMFGALLRISEIEDGMRRKGFLGIDLSTIGEDVLDYYLPVAQEHGIALTLDTSGPIMIRADPGMLFEALANLVENGIKFTPHGGSVAVRLGPGPVIRVADSGPGIAEADREAVKRRFHRGRNGAGHQGHGLGLALVGAVARIHGLAFDIEDGDPGCVVTLGRGSAGMVAPQGQATELALAHGASVKKYFSQIAVISRG